jgi:outer membrane protein assembly factor BamB
VVNGVVFALSAGSRTAPAVLYALDGATGKEVWNSGKSIATYSTTGISAGGSKVFVGTHDGMLYAFGYMLNRE